MTRLGKDNAFNLGLTEPLAREYRVQSVLNRFNNLFNVFAGAAEWRHDHNYISQGAKPNPSAQGRLADEMPLAFCPRKTDLGLSIGHQFHGCNQSPASNITYGWVLLQPRKALLKN